MNKRVYETVATRANGRCECGCRQRVPPGELDHMLGRKVEETEFVCWILHPACHHRKTANAPSAGYWLRLFIAHCQGLYLTSEESARKQGYLKAAGEAKKKLDWLIAKGTTT